MSTPTYLPSLLKASVIIGIEDVRGFYTLRTWAFGWLLRVIFQVLFFAVIGRLLGSADAVRFLVIGGAVAIAALEALTVVLFTAFDRAFGMLPLLVSSPGNYFLVVVARNLNCIVTGTFTATIALIVCPFIVGAPLPYPRTLLAIPIILLGASSTYLFGTFLSAVVLKTMEGRWLILNMSFLALATVGGFYVPTSFWPLPVRALGQVLPFTHALRAIRELVGGAAAASVAGQCGLEILVAACWFLLAWGAFKVSIALARRDGSIDLAGM
jgi:ABC-2 type transport system permease protein